MSEETVTPEQGAVDPVIDPAATPQTDPAINPTPADPKPATVLDGGGDPTVATDWPEDWREKYAGEDEKLLKRLQRYSSPQSALDALISAQNKIASGEYKSPLAKDVSEEEVKQWRLDNGIPETPDGYEIKLENGMTLGEADNDLVKGLLEVAHGENMHPDTVNKMLSWAYGLQEQELTRESQTAAEFHNESVTKLKEEWGADYGKNVNLINSLLDGAGEGVKNLFTSGMLAGGQALGDHPEVLRWLADLSRQVNPSGTLVPATGTAAAQSLETEYNEIRKLMGDSESDYWKGPKAAQLQGRFKELVGMRQQMK